MMDASHLFLSLVLCFSKPLFFPNTVKASLIYVLLHLGIFSNFFSLFPLPLSNGQMSSPIMSHGVFLITALLHFFLLHNSVSCVSQWRLLRSPPFTGAEEEKIRLGSTPPSCHNRCNACNPCKAVQVPTTPGPTGRPDRFGEENRRPPDQPAYSQYNSNYKPLEWKCSCGARIFTP